MTEPLHPRYPVFVMCGSDAKRRRILEELDPEEKYKARAMLPFLGKRLIDWQLDALRGSPFVEDIYLLGLSEADIRFDFPVHYVPVETRAGFADKLMAGKAYLEGIGKQPQMIVISSSDAPGVRLKEVDDFFAQLVENADSEFVISLVPNELVEAVFPKSGRVVVHFKDGDLFPGELYALSPRAIEIGYEVIDEISRRRRMINREKKKISMGPILRFVGQRPQMWSVLLKYGLGMATLADAERGFSAAFKCQTKGVVIHDAGFGMDMDLPEDYERLEKYMQGILSQGESVS